MAGLIERLRRKANKDPGFDPGKRGQPTATYSFVSRLLNLTARSFMVEKPAAMHKIVGLMLIFFSNPDNVPTDPLTPAEVADLRKKFRTPEPVVEDSPHSPGEEGE